MTIYVQPPFVALGNWRGPNQKPIPVEISTEWHKSLTALVKLVEAQQTTIEALEARVTALGG